MKELPRRGAILVAEDSPDDQMLANLALKRVGTKNPVHIVPDGSHVVHYLTGEGPYADRERFPLPELILLDLEMPRMNGFEVLTWLRQQPEFRHLPVVVVTKSVFSPDVTRAYQLGANSFVTKSNDLTEFGGELSQAIDAFCGRSSVARFRRVGARTDSAA